MANPIAGNVESEINNTQDNADPVTLGAAMTGQLSTITDVDFYSITASAAGTLSIIFDVPTNSASTDYFVLGLYNSAETLLSSSHQVIIIKS